MTYMQGCLVVPQSTISQQLGKLCQAGIIEGERQGLEVWYSLQDDRVRKILEILFDNQKDEEGNSK